MYFKHEYTIRQMHFQANESVEFSYGRSHSVVVTLRCPTEKEQRIGHQNENAFCTVIGQWRPSVHVRRMFEDLAADRLPPGSVKPEGSPWNRYIDEEGNIERNYVVPLTFLPQQFQSFVSQVDKELRDYANRTVTTLRWRHAYGGPHNPFSIRGQEWSFDGELWRPTPITTNVAVDLRGSLHVSDETRNEVEHIVLAGENELLGHELYLEAWQQRHQNPRSALILGVAAAEVGFK